MRKFERSARVVIEPAHQTVVQRKWDPYLGKNFLHRFEMLSAFLVEKLADARQRLDDRLILGHFAIEDAQRIGDRTALAIDAHLLYHWFESLAKSLVEFCSIFLAADRIQLEIPSCNAEAVEQRRQHLEQLGIARGRLAACRCGTDDFGVDLIKLSVTSLLRAFAAEHWADAVELVQAAIPEFVFDVGADDARRSLGTKSKRLPPVALGAPAILPRVHFFRDNIGLFAHAASEQFCRLEDRRANFLEVVGAEDIAHRRLHKIPQRRLRRQQVSRSSDSFNHVSR